MYFSTGSEQRLWCSQETWIVGENSHVQIIERTKVKWKSVLTNSVTEIFAQKRAIVDYYKIQNDNLTANLIDNTYVSQKQSSVAVNTFLWRKPNQKQLEFLPFWRKNSKLLKRNWRKQHVDHYTLVQHATQIVKVIKITKESFLTDRCFQRKNLREKRGTKKPTHSKNNNILLSDKATINAKTN
jgi:Fe-S cluster assembly protein SufD